jgi:hypothetical protein
MRLLQNQQETMHLNPSLVPSPLRVNDVQNLCAHGVKIQETHLDMATRKKKQELLDTDKPLIAL